MMRKTGFRFFSVLLSVLVLCVSLCGTAFGADIEYIQKPTFWHWLNGQGSILNGIVAYGLGQACPNSDDGYHRSSSYEYESSLRGGYRCICDYCGAKFTAYETDLQQSYNDYVETLPASGYTSDNGLIWRPIIEDVDRFYLGNSSISESKNEYTYDPSVPCIILPIQRYSGNPVNYSKSLDINLIAPISASYIPLNSLSFSYYAVHQSGATSTGEGYYDLSAAHFVQGRTFRASMSFLVENYQYIRFQCFFPVYKLIPDVPLSGDTYDINTRPTSITGGNYGIVGDNGQITKVEDNSTIINETNNTFYNPATGQTVPIVNWSYDYSDRSYKVTLESGDTTTITYGDEYITIKEGDTIYNVYYLIDGSGTVSPPCTHEWTETNRADPACTRPGSVASTCSKCQQTKTESIPAPGHTWQVKQSVTTQYDEEGNLVQQGYTIYQCSACGEQYKDETGAGPPGGGGSTTDPGEDKETIWDKLANWAASVFGGLIGMAEAVPGKILDALISLTDMLMERLKTVVETVLSIFDELPKLFGGFLDFLGAVFPFLPPELMTLLTFGIIAVVAIGIFKAVRR